GARDRGGCVGVLSGRGGGAAGRPHAAVGEVVVVGEQFVGGEVEVGVRAPRGAQLSHGGRGVEAVTDDVADDEGDPGAGEGYDVEPVTADPAGRVGRLVPGGDRDGGSAAEPAGQQGALHGAGGGAFAGEAAGVVDAEGGAGDDLLGEAYVVVLKRAGATGPGEGGHAQDDAPGPERDHHQGAEIVLQE